MAESFTEELSEVDDLHFLPTYGAFEKYDAEGSSETLLGSLPPRLRKTPECTMTFSNFTNRRDSASQLTRTCKCFLSELETLDRWARGTSAMLHGGDDRYEAFGHYLKNRLSIECLLSSYESLASKTTMGVGGKERWYAEPRNLVDLRSLIEACDLLSVPRVMLGRGSNLIVPDDGYAGLVIRMKGSFWSDI